MKSENNQSKMSLKNLGLLCAAGISVLLASELKAADYTWDSSGLNPATPVAGTGTWSTTDANWSDGSVDSAWSNTITGGNANNAIITGSSALTLGSAISVRNITNTGTTTISGGTITAVSNSATTGSAAGPGIAGGTSLTISSVITGTKGLGITSGTVTLSGANTYTGITLISSSNGSLKLGATNTLPTATALTTFGSGRTLDMNGFSQMVGSLNGSNGIIKNGTATNVTFTINGSGNVTSGQSIQNSINLVKLGSGTQGLSASQNGATSLSYTGTTTVSGGTLKLATANSNLTATSSVLVDGGLLVSVAAGNLNLGVGNVTMSSGGITPGELGVLSTFTLAATKSITTTGGSLNFDLGNNAGAPTYDSIIGSGAGSGFSLTNTTLALNLLAGFNYNPAGYQIFSGFASGATSGLTITGYDTVNYSANLSNGGLLTFTAVPEPSTYALFGAGLIALAILRRRTRTRV